MPPGLPGAVVNGEGFARDRLVGGVRRLDLELEAVLPRLLVNQIDHEVEVGCQRLKGRRCRYVVASIR